MGHSTATISIDADTAETIRRGEQPRSRYSVPFVTAMVDAAVGIWHSDEAGRWDDPRQGDGVLAPVMSEASVYRWSDKNIDAVIDRSAVIPVADPDDVKVTTKTVRIPVSAERLRAEQARQAAQVATLWANDVLLASYDHTLTAAKVVGTPALRAPKAQATEGAAKTVYRLVAPGSFSDAWRIKKKLDVSYDTQAEARAAAVTLMKDNPTIPRLAVRACIVRPQTEDLVIIERPVSDDPYLDVELTFSVPKKNARIKSYTVMFDYHS